MIVMGIEPVNDSTIREPADFHRIAELIGCSDNKFGAGYVRDSEFGLQRLDVFPNRLLLLV